MRQLKNMFHSKRVVATLIYLAALIGTLVVAFTVRCRAADERAARALSPRLTLALVAHALGPLPSLPLPRSLHFLPLA